MEVIAFPRSEQGSGASRRLRRAGQTPGIIYGGSGEPVNIALDHNALFHALKKEAFHSSILEMELQGKTEKVLLRDHQLHPFRPLVLHIDFQRVSANEKIHVKVPFHFLHEDTAPGVKIGGGIVAHIMTESEVSCLPKDLPEFIEVDLGALEMGQSVHLSQINLPKGIEFVALAHGNDAAVAAIAKTRGGVSDDATDDAAPAAPAAPAAE
jgi:large subunit ribosomal protein L25